ncbi:MAG TPA: DNA-processing protein DprA [Ktedonobacteraceae bacterium]|nr:DNA-processing protein DprA [Ktedonobacteraceae bacterium]
MDVLDGKNLSLQSAPCSADLDKEAASYWIAFNRVLGIGPVSFRLLLNHFQDDLATAWQADRQELARAGLHQKTIDALIDQRAKIEPAREVERLEKAQIEVLTWRDPAYPALLREIDAAPPVLYLKGKLTEADRFALAVVGTRNADHYGQQATERLVTDLARGQVTVVSGLALGIDAIAHHAALDAGGRTIAVMACGLDIIYPAKNAKLARRIVESNQGALLSEHPVGVQPDGGNFPARNRVISGLSQGVLVVEAGERSGALITAGFALKQGREVFAVPGSIFASRCLGTNRLIREGAHLVLDVKDILEALNLFMLPQQMEMQQALPENAEERDLLALLGHEPIHINEMIIASGLPAPTVTATLTLLELKGLVKAIGSAQFVLAR